LCLSPAAAFGADLLGKAPPIIRQPAASASPSLSSGFYAGVNAGFGFGEMTTSSSTSNSIGNLTVDNAKMRQSGPLGGFQAGYALQSGSVVYGLEGDIDFGGLRGTMNSAGVITTTAATLATPATPGSPATTAATPVQTIVNAHAESRINALGTLRGRIGYAFDNVLIYGTGGYAMAHHNTKVSLQATGAPGSAAVSRNGSSVAVPAAGPTALAGTDLGTTSVHQWANGWALGAGGEFAFSPNMSLKLEYLHAQLRDKVAGQSVSHSVNLVRTGVNYRF
jgi:opacity protein-like surface antigen